MTAAVPTLLPLSGCSFVAPETRHPCRKDRTPGAEGKEPYSTKASRGSILPGILFSGSSFHVGGCYRRRRLHWKPFGGKVARYRIPSSWNSIALLPTTTKTSRRQIFRAFSAILDLHCRSWTFAQLISKRCSIQPASSFISPVNRECGHRGPKGSTHMCHAISWPPNACSKPPPPWVCQGSSFPQVLPYMAKLTGIPLPKMSHSDPIVLTVLPSWRRKLCVRPTAQIPRSR